MQAILVLNDPRTLLNPNSSRGLKVNQLNLRDPPTVRVAQVRLAITKPNVPSLAPPPPRRNRLMIPMLLLQATMAPTPTHSPVPKPDKANVHNHLLNTILLRSLPLLRPPHLPMPPLPLKMALNNARSPKSARTEERMPKGNARKAPRPLTAPILAILPPLLPPPQLAPLNRLLLVTPRPLLAMVAVVVANLSNVVLEAGNNSVIPWRLPRRTMLRSVAPRSSRT